MARASYLAYQSAVERGQRTRASETKQDIVQALQAAIAHSSSQARMQMAERGMETQATLRREQMGLTERLAGRAEEFETGMETAREEGRVTRFEREEKGRVGRFERGRKATKEDTARAAKNAIALEQGKNDPLLGMEGGGTYQVDADGSITYVSSAPSGPQPGPYKEGYVYPTDARVGGYSVKDIAKARVKGRLAEQGIQIASEEEKALKKARMRITAISGSLMGAEGRYVNELDLGSLESALTELKSMVPKSEEETFRAWYITAVDNQLKALQNAAPWDGKGEYETLRQRLAGIMGVPIGPAERTTPLQAIWEAQPGVQLMKGRIPFLHQIKKAIGYKG